MCAPNAKASDPAALARESKVKEWRYAGFAAPNGSVFCLAASARKPVRPDAPRRQRKGPQASCRPWVWAVPQSNCHLYPSSTIPSGSHHGNSILGKPPDATQRMLLSIHDSVRTIQTAMSLDSNIPHDAKLGDNCS
jgi:hypothetical protein